MNSQTSIIEIITILQERLSRYGQVAISELGIFKVTSQPSKSKSLTEDKFTVSPPQKGIILDANPLTPTDTTLISGLASSLEISHEASEKIINLFSKEILSQLPVTIPDFGTFKKSSNELRFSADPKLISHVVGIYADMTPIELVKNAIAAQKPQDDSIFTSKERYTWPAVLVPLIVILAIGGYFLTRGIIGSGDQESAQPTTVSESMESAVSDGDVPPPSTEHNVFSESEQFDDSPSASDSPASDQISTNTPPTTPSASNTQGFATTNLLDRESGGYTLIVASFDAPARTLSVVERYRKIYPNLPVDTLINSTNRHRVAIGQVSTISEALALKERLTEIPPASWPLNISNTDL